MTEKINDIEYDKFLFLKRLDHINYKKPYFKSFIGDKKLEIKGPILCTKYSKNKQILLNSDLMAFVNIVSRFDGVIYHNFMNMFGIDDDIVVDNENDLYEYFNITSEEKYFIQDIIG